MKVSIASLLLALLAICQASAIPTIPVELLSRLRDEGSADIMIILTDPVQPIITRINSLHFTNSVAKAEALVADLRSFTGQSQESILSFLDENHVGSPVQAFWITNRIFVPKASMKLVERLGASFGPQIAEIRLPIQFKMDYTMKTVRGPPPATMENEWNINIIRAQEVWDDGYSGQGVVVSHIDSGVRSSHESLMGKLRNTHAWLDPFNASMTPIDEQGHGTHTMGTILGSGGIGVAPNATYMTCRLCHGPDNICTEPAAFACGQWTTCPTQPDGTDEDCSKKPALSSNSWGLGDDPENQFYNDVINAWRAADIIPIFAIGNRGDACSTGESPGDQPNLISVGATTNIDFLATFSSRGPTRLTAMVKPEVSAPGQDVRSAFHTGDDEYVVGSGTSMATPHVAGAVALMLSKNQNLTFEQVDMLLKESCFHPRMEDVICTGAGVNNSSPWPNNLYGHGRIDVKRAVDAVQS